MDLAQQSLTQINARMWLCRSHSKHGGCSVFMWRRIVIAVGLVLAAAIVLFAISIAIQSWQVHASGAGATARFSTNDTGIGIAGLAPLGTWPKLSVFWGGLGP